MIFDAAPPTTAYLTDSFGNIIKAKVYNASISMDISSQATMTIECSPISFIRKEDISSKEIDPAVFQTLLEDGYGRNTEVQKEVAEKAS